MILMLTLICSCIGFSFGKSINFIWVETNDVGEVNMAGQGLQRTIKVATDLVHYGVEMTNRMSVNFQLKACKDVHITLVGANENIAFQLRIGSHGNTGIFLSSLTYTMGSFFTNGILDCNAFVPFWFSWENMRFRLGFGTVIGQDELLNHQHPDNTGFIGFERMLVYTGWGTDGLWIFDIDASPVDFFRRAGGKRGNMRLLLVLKAESETRCSHQCNLTDDCLGYNYHSNTNDCELVDGNQLIATSEDIGWMCGAKCLHGTSACLLE